MGGVIGRQNPSQSGPLEFWISIDNLCEYYGGLKARLCANEGGGRTKGAVVRSKTSDGNGDVESERMLSLLMATITLLGMGPEVCEIADMIGENNERMKVGSTEDMRRYGKPWIEVERSVQVAWPTAGRGKGAHGGQLVGGNNGRGVRQ